ncbi:hypothetical protein BACPU_26050 [Bacillus pumilus]|nr:hypothetical protein BACPU_26050 [Bacillus pumilus]
MRTSDILDNLNELNKKKDELEEVLSTTDLEAPRTVLNQALDRCNNSIDTFLSSEFVPASTALYLVPSPKEIKLDGGNYVQLHIKAVKSDGTSKDLKNGIDPVILFRDFDKVANNTGNILNVDVSQYTGPTAFFELIKTDVGFDIDDDIFTQGLRVSQKEEHLYAVTDFKGEPIGIEFTTDDAVATGDNWRMDVYVGQMSVLFRSEDETVATVNDVGLVNAVGGGSTRIIISNGPTEIIVPVLVRDDIAPEPPSVLFVEPSEEAADEYIITYEESPDDDVAYYRLFLDGVEVKSKFVDNPISLPLVPSGDEEETHEITMTAVDTSDNESELSNKFILTIS